MRLPIALTLLLLTACAGTGTDVRRSGENTFSFVEPMAVEAAGFPDEVVQQFRGSVGDALRARGLQEVASGGDLVVDVIANVESVVTRVGIVNPDLTRVRHTSQPVLFTSRHIDGVEVRDLRVDEGSMKVVVRRPDEARVRYAGRSTQRLRHIGVDNSAEVIDAAVRESFAAWRR